MIKKLASYLGEYKKTAILSPLFVAMESILEVVIPFLMAYLIDNGINKNDINEIYRIGVILIICAIASLVFGILSGRFASKASTGFARNLRRGIYYKVQEFSFSNIDKFSVPSIITRQTTDITNVQMAFQMLIRIAVKTPVMLISALIMSFAINKELSLIFLFVVPFLGIGLYFIATKAHPMFEKTFKIYDKLNEDVQENVRGIRVVKSYVTEDKEIEKFKSTSKDILDNFSKAERIVALNQPLMQISMNAVIILLAWFGGRYIISETLTTGQLTSLISYAMQILMSLMMLSMVLVMILISRASVERIVEILSEESDIKDKENPIMEVKDGSITFDNVSFSYVKDENKMCLTDINLEIKSRRNYWNNWRNRKLKDHICTVNTKTL